MSAQPTGRRPRRLALLAASVVAAHALLLSAVLPTPPQPAPLPPAEAAVRVVTLPMPAELPSRVSDRRDAAEPASMAANEAPTQAASLVQPMQPMQATQHAQHAKHAQPVQAMQPTRNDKKAQPVQHALPAPTRMAGSSEAFVAVDSAPARPARHEAAAVVIGDPLAPAVLQGEAGPELALVADEQGTWPTYATRIPSDFDFAYDLHRGFLSGKGRIAFRREGSGGYEATLEGTVAGFSVLGWTSRGAIDRDGLAPARFVDQRRGRSAQAANFVRDRGTPHIGYSGNAADNPLPRGAQDRLTWLLQLAAIAEAEPARLRPNAEISMYVSGARGDASGWTFIVQGVERIQTPAGATDAIRLLREPRKPRDTRAEVWLDPQRQHLPVKARLGDAENDANTIELVLAGTS